jgi:hypothetical protein
MGNMVVGKLNFSEYKDGAAKAGRTRYMIEATNRSPVKFLAIVLLAKLFLEVGKLTDAKVEGLTEVKREACWIVIEIPSNTKTYIIRAFLERIQPD